jgi:hypothetical protein
VFLHFHASDVEIEKPSWKTYTLEEEATSRFIDLAYDSENNPIIIYYAENAGGGVKAFYSENTIKDYIFSDREWKQENFSGNGPLGFFLSADIDEKDVVHLSFMNYDIGNDILYYYNSSSRKQVAVDSITQSGIGAGMHSSIVFVKGEGPYIFYHVEQGRRFMLSKPGADPILLETGSGLNTDAAVIGNMIYVAHRGRDDMKLRLSTYNTETGDWETKIREETASTIAVSTFKERPYAIFFNYLDKGIYFSFFDDEPKKIANGHESRISTDANENAIYVSFNRQGEGLFLLNTTDASVFYEQIFISGRRAGVFNSLKVTQKGDLKVAYLEDEALKYLEYEVSSYLYHSKQREIKKRAYLGLFFVFLAISAFLLYAALLKNRLKKKDLKSPKRGKTL